MHNVLQNILKSKFLKKPIKYDFFLPIEHPKRKMIIIYFIKYVNDYFILVVINT